LAAAHPPFLTESLPKPDRLFADVDSPARFAALMSPRNWTGMRAMVGQLSLHEDALAGSYQLESALDALIGELDPAERDDWFRQIAWFRPAMFARLDQWANYLDEGSGWGTVLARPSSAAIPARRRRRAIGAACGRRSFCAAGHFAGNTWSSTRASAGVSIFCS
jgi:hypothetical protein